MGIVYTMNSQSKTLSVLMVGCAQSYHIEPLARCIKAADPSILLTNCGLWSVGEAGTRIPRSASPFFDHIFIDLSQPKAPTPSTKPLIDRKTVAKRHRSIFYVCLKQCTYAAYVQYKIVKSTKLFRSRVGTHDVIHLQSLFMTPAHYWLLAEQKLPFIVSCWGSDILRHADPRIVMVQRQLLERSAAITYTGPEFKEVVLAKFGRHLESKMFNTYFNPSVAPLMNESQVPDQTSLPSTQVLTKICICIGHNGSRENNHLAILADLKTLDPAIKCKITLQIPMTYSAPMNYVDEVRAAASGVGCDFEVVTTFMTEEQMIAFRRNINILVFAPVSDAFAASVSQSLSVGSTVILGGWLPNRLRREAGFYFHEVNRLTDVAATVDRIIRDWQQELARSFCNVKLAKDIFSEEVIGRQWTDIYHSVIRNRQ